MTTYLMYNGRQRWVVAVKPLLDAVSAGRPCLLTLLCAGSISQYLGPPTRIWLLNEAYLDPPPLAVEASPPALRMAPSLQPWLALSWLLRAHASPNNTPSRGRHHCRKWENVLLLRWHRLHSPADECGRGWWCRGKGRTARPGACPVEIAQAILSKKRCVAELAHTIVLGKLRQSCRVVVGKRHGAVSGWILHL